jgi:hypothetical protein
MIIRDVPENFNVLKKKINPTNPTKLKEVLICLDPCFNINIIPPKFRK